MSLEKSQNSLLRFIRDTDKVTLIAALFASAYGLLLVYSATFRLLKDGARISADVRSMLISIALGVVFAIIVSNIDYEIISKLWPIIAGGCVGLMIITYFFGVAPPSRPDAKSWLDLGFFQFQTSEILKVGFIISFSYHLDMVKSKINDFKTILGLCLHGLIPVMLVIMTGDAGSALIFLLMFVGMLFMARVSILYFISGVSLVACALPIAWKLNLISGIQRQRILALIYPESYPKVIYQQENAKIAMGTGGMFGKGFLQGDYTQGGLVPENQNDMILSVAGEEFGFVGAIMVIGVLMIIILRVFFNGFKARDNVGFMMCSGVAIMLFSQMCVNVGMELTMLPCIGITLPFFSAGGSSSLSVYVALGLVLSIYRFSRTPDDMMFYSRKI